MVNKGGSRVAVATDGDALVNAIGMNGADVVELIAHASGPGDVRDVARAIEAAADDVIHHAACISDPETARLDTTHCGGADDGDTLNYMVDILIRLMNGDRRRWFFFHLLICCFYDVSGEIFRDAFRDDSNSFQRRTIHGLHGDVIGRSQRCKIDHDVGVRMFSSRLFGCFVN